jgi:uncharacterized membrane protein YgcG
MPAKWVRRLRLGQPAWDPKTQRPLFSHVFQSVEEDKERRDDRGALDAQIKAVNDLLEGLKRQKGGGGGGGGGSSGSGAGGGGSSGGGGEKAKPGSGSKAASD